VKDNFVRNTKVIHKLDKRAFWESIYYARDARVFKGTRICVQETERYTWETFKCRESTSDDKQINLLKNVLKMKKSRCIF